MWDTIQTSTTHLSHDLPCQNCAHAAHTFLPCSDTCRCAPTAMPGTVTVFEVDCGLVALAA